MATRRPPSIYAREAFPTERVWTEAQVDALLAERDAMQAKVEAMWQPIETAPSKGPLLLVSMASPDPLATFGCYPIEGSDGEWRIFSHDSKWRMRPTHWMPLPAPPAIVRAAAALDAGRMDGEKAQ